uniref:ABC transporter permease n=1 Tax=Aldersonia kunmingensis TaxID=408066 RepID=UPI000A9BABE9
MNSVGDAVLRIGPALAVVIVLLAVVAVVVNRLADNGHARGTLTASIRAVVQLAALAAVLGIVIRTLWASVLFVVLMACVAAWTSSGRIIGRRGSLSGTLRCLAPVAGPTLLIVT